MRHTSKPTGLTSRANYTTEKGVLLKPRYQMNTSNRLPRDPSPSETARRLERIADVRSSVVARGKALVARPEYPEPRVVRAVARLLASKWSK